MNDLIERFWNLIISKDEKLNEKGWEEWNKFNELYPDYREIIKPCFSQEFYSIYNSVNFHDFDILEVKCDFHRNTGKEVSICILDYFNDYKKNLCLRIVYTNVVSFRFDIGDIIYSLSWSNDIFEILADGKIKHRILLSNGSYIEIVSESVGIEVFEKNLLDEKQHREVYK